MSTWSKISLLFAGGFVLLVTFTVATRPITASKPTPPAPTGVTGYPLLTTDQGTGYAAACGFNVTWRTLLFQPSAGETRVTADVRATGAGAVWLSVQGGGVDVQPVTGPGVLHLSAALPAPGLDFPQIALGGNGANCPSAGVSVDALTVHVTP